MLCSMYLYHNQRLTLYCPFNTKCPLVLMRMCKTGRLGCRSSSKPVGIQCQTGIIGSNASIYIYICFYPIIFPRYNNFFSKVLYNTDRSVIVFQCEIFFFWFTNRDNQSHFITRRDLTQTYYIINQPGQHIYHKCATIFPMFICIA